MGSFTKWLGAGLGFTLGGPIGSIIGFAVGSFVDGVSKDDILKEYQQTQSGRGASNTQSGDFEISLLILASIVIKADGKVDQRELDFVRSQFVDVLLEQQDPEQLLH